MVLFETDAAFPKSKYRSETKSIRCCAEPTRSKLNYLTANIAISLTSMTNCYGASATPAGLLPAANAAPKGVRVTPPPLMLKADTSLLT